ncbi:MAG: hypothetical protein WD063_12020 [Pirellulales bacterium]
MRTIFSSVTRLKRLVPAAGCCAAALIAAVSVSPLSAQPADKGPADENPFDVAQPAADEEPKPAANEEPKPDEKPAPDADEKPAPAAKPAPAPAEAQSKPEPVPDDPAVRTVLESHPATPFELLRAIRILADLGHPKLAKPFIDELGKQKLDLAAKAALVNRFDSAMLIRLARNPDLAESLGPFIDDLFRSAEAYRRDPQRLALWAGQLSDPDESVRARAVVALLQAREAAVAPLVAILADPARAAEHERARRILVQLDDLAIEPLVGVLESPDAALKTQVIEVLGALEAHQAAAELLVPLVSPSSTPQLRAAAAGALKQTSGQVPDMQEALRLLEHAASRRLEQSRDESGDGPPSVVVWQWYAKQKASVPVLYDRTGASLASAVRLAGDLFELDRQSAARRRLYLTALLEAAQLRNGLGNALPSGPGTVYEAAAGYGAQAVEDVLVHAMDKGYIPAATAAAQILGDIGTLDLLARGGAAPGALARAAYHADRRLRFAAIGAILKLRPGRPFAGSSYVTEGLKFLAGSYGAPRILIAHPLSDEGGKLAGLAATLGYEADVATNGRQAYELAIQSPDYELVLIHSAIARPAADELLAQLRRDRRTAQLPVGLIAPVNDLARVDRFARRAGRAEAFLQPQKEAEMKLFTGDVLAHAGRSYVTSAERKVQALAALDALVALAQSPQRVFDTGRLEAAILPLLYVPEVAPRAAELLAEIGTDEAQRAFLELADSAAGLAMRKAAVAVFARSVRKHGILLTSGEIRRQYDLYNTNAGRDAETHEVLAAVLDVIEYKGDPPERQ